ncbi:GDP-mannose-dependent alpha-mannosyltransferase [Falsiruegeria litorea R37]|uniref:GDP-mannose-dependent alpha-mannosyltransferase n=1 Tax=Falsiruegeria litorea R37 TaxID=1200284 RepID=A0A1Y5RWU3_9RHOB|nr:glycosyltransferase family 4 protein [Falsiruegeria litorea]SLN26814.1 GDP-mannose-dependent alpha-mannosyltransferase [Falsiruegeria litorea R37]
MRVQNVLIVSDFANVNGGQAKVAIDSALLLAQAGVQVVFFAASGKADPKLSHDNIRTVCLGQHTLADNPSRLNAMTTGLWNRAGLRALKLEVAKLDPARTVIHCHGWAKALSPSIGRVLALGRLPVLYTMHEYFLACPNGGFYDYRQQEICKRRPLSLSCLSVNCDARHGSHKVWRVARSALARGPGHIPRGLTDVAYISQTQLHAMRPSLPDSTRLHSLPNPVEVGGPKVDATQNKAFVFVGRFSPEKGALQFAKAAQVAGVEAVFVGDGPDAHDIRNANPDARITGWLDNVQVQAELGLARALVFPSQWYECQPLVPIEALLRGVPVVCGGWTAAAEVVQDGVNGVVHQTRTVETLAESLRRVQQISHFDSDELAQDVSPVRHVSRLIEIYDGMLG